MNLREQFKKEKDFDCYAYRQDYAGAHQYQDGFNDDYVEWLEESVKRLPMLDVGNCVYVVTERDNYGEQLFKQVFGKREEAVEFLKEQGLTETTVDEITKIDLD